MGDIRADLLTGVGGSEAAAVCGLDPYRTPLDVWETKMGTAPPFEGNEHTEWGHRLEDAVARKFREGHPRLIPMIDRSDTLVRHSAKPWAISHPDRVYLDEDGLFIVQIKCTARLNDLATDPISQKRLLAWRVQLQHDMACCDGWEGQPAAHGALVVLVGGYQYMEFPQDPVPLFQEWMLERERVFWEQFVLTRQRPGAMRGGDYAVLARLRGPEGDPNADGQAATLPPEAAELDREYVDLGLAVKLAEARRETIKAIMADMIGTRSSGRTANGGEWSWRYRKRKGHTVDPSEGWSLERRRTK